jgi:N-acylglucosamine-6-phosphate 2-epimerase
MRDARTMSQVAQAAVAGGAVAVRLQGIDDVQLSREVLDVPIIGLWKVGGRGVFITPTLEHARSVREAGADIVALDGTRRDRPDGLTLAETISSLKADRPTLVMADCGSVDDAVAADAAGADLIGTTLAGYTDERPAVPGPDLELVELIVARLPHARVVAEGRIHTPAQAGSALQAGAFAVVVGTAITHPTAITTWFRAAMTRSE